MKVAHFSFDEDLASLLMGRHGQRRIDYTFTGPQSAKHLIESLGIPHTEIGALLANGSPISEGYLVADGDELTVSCKQAESGADIEPTFVLDGHLGRLASRLRMLGLDCIYENEVQDDDLASISVSQGRILVTRDRRLLMRKVISRGYLVRSLSPGEQLPEVFHRFGLRNWVRPFQRCIRCNALLQPVAKADILSRLEPLTKRYFEEFKICPACSQIYWKGSHFERMAQIIAGLD